MVLRGGGRGRWGWNHCMCLLRYYRQRGHFPLSIPKDLTSLLVWESQVPKLLSLSLWALFYPSHLMSVRSWQHAAFVCVISEVCSRNDLSSPTSPELLCTLLLCLPGGIFLRGGVLKGFRAVTAVALSSTTATGVNSASWNIIRGNQEGFIENV